MSNAYWIQVGCGPVALLSHMVVLVVPCRLFVSPEPLTVFSGPEPGSELEAVAVTAVTWLVSVSVVKLQTLPLITVEVGGALTSSTRQ